MLMTASRYLRGNKTVHLDVGKDSLVSLLAVAHCCSSKIKHLTSNFISKGCFFCTEQNFQD